MCCLFSTLALLGPRAGILFWWLIDPGRWGLAFDTFVWPFLGFLFVPWTTLMYVAVFPGGIDGFDYVWLALALVIDIGSYTAGGVSGRRRYATGTY